MSNTHLLLQRVQGFLELCARNQRQNQICIPLYITPPTTSSISPPPVPQIMIIKNVLRYCQIYAAGRWEDKTAPCEDPLIQIEDKEIQNYWERGTLKLYSDQVKNFFILKICLTFLQFSRTKVVAMEVSQLASDKTLSSRRAGFSKILLIQMLEYKLYKIIYSHSIRFPPNTQDF